MITLSYWKPGEVVITRGMWSGRIWYAGPAFVVQDTRDLLVLYWRAGTQCKNVRKRVTAQDLLAPNQPELVDFIWTETDVLMISIPGEAHSIWAIWETGQPKLRCWYVNLEIPLQRTSLGFDTMDQELDIVISPDLSEWHWKDEDSFQEMVEAGVFTSEEASEIRAEGERAIQKLTMGQSPFCDGWEKWSPPQEWTLPKLPQGWDKL